MMPGFSQDLQDVRDARKTAVINDELKRLNIGIATLQETRLAGAGTLKEKDYTSFWQGKNFDEPRVHGVSFAVRNSLLNMIEPNSGGSVRLLTLRFNTNEDPVNLVSVYAPTLSATSDTKDEFYENFASTARNIPRAEQLLLLGDFNARVGADNDSWPSCVDSFGVGKLNIIGQRLLELCAVPNLCIANSFFKTKPEHKVSWRNPRSKHWHQLDLIVVWCAAIKNVLHTTLLPQCGLRHRPLPDVLQDQAATKKVPRCKESGGLAH
ncbi:craniofacial development protein 2 [Octopus bimaculoides]|uniref:craniofacial development protein 2 n=1 Tax=Octopus bimaculoides TaxID=37653 RepID=UPI00071D086F|nr:craniofacial development protein 2 [Octopus bimaculoides]|eukprot:XP_014770573.1 PREDICTED: craniofacial development protein 2-like [Octopus bimaculoides]